MKTIQVMTLALLLVAGAGLSACSDRAEADREGYAMADDPNFLTETEKEFIQYASEMHVGEIEMGQQAKQKSANEDVKKYADAVIKTHTDALEELSDKTDEIVLSKIASPDTQGHMEFLSRLSGARFDKEFVDLMVADHQSAFDSFKSQHGGAQSGNLKEYMKSAQSDLEARLDEARDLQKKLTAR
jgi:putative membrane protein